MGGRKTTAASVRFLSNEVKEVITKSNSAKETWFFSLYYGDDNRDDMEVNVFRNSEPNSFGSFFTHHQNEFLFLLDGKTAHEVAGLGGHNSKEDFQMFSQDETIQSKFELLLPNHPEERRKKKEERRKKKEERRRKTNLQICRSETKDGRRVGLRSINRILENPIHPLITIQMFIICILHMFLRISEKVILLALNRIAAISTLNNENEEQKRKRVCKNCD